MLLWDLNFLAVSASFTCTAPSNTSLCPIVVMRDLAIRKSERARERERERERKREREREKYLQCI